MPTLVPFGAICFGIACGAGLYRLTPVWDRSARRMMGNRIEECTRLGVSPVWLRVGMRCWGLAVIANFAMFGFVLRMMPIAVATSWLVIVAPGYLLDFIIRRRRALIRDQLVTASQTLSSAVEAGLSVPEGLAMTSKEIQAPLSGHLRRVVFDFNCGRPLREALLNIKNKLQIESFTIFSSAIQVARDRGGPVHDSLRRISHSLEENQRLERRIEAETAGGMRVVQILAVFPFVFLLMMQALMPKEVGILFSSFIGRRS